MILKIENLAAWYEKDKNVLDGVTLQVEAGSIVGILGKNGQGKSTLLNTITGIHENYNGNIIINGESAISTTKVKRLRYYVQDIPVLFDELSPMSYFTMLHNIYRKEFRKELCEAYAEKFEFTRFLNTRIGNLSLGNRQKVVIIGGLLIRAPLLVLDEPLLGLDVTAIEQFYEEIRLYADQEHAVIFSSHIIDTLEHVCTKVIFLHDKRIVREIALEKETDLREEFNKVMGHV